MISRRELIQLSSIIPFSLSKRIKNRYQKNPQAAGQKNILIVVFDAFSGMNLPINGYARNTIPNITRLMDRAYVYHRHYAGGNFTSPGTSSMLTGLYPWTTRVINLRQSIINNYKSNNIFDYFNDYYRFAYTQNETAFDLIDQFKHSIDLYKKPSSLFIYCDLPGIIFRNDNDIARLSARRIYQDNRILDNSLFLRKLYSAEPINNLIFKQKEKVEKEYADMFPRGIPATYKDYFSIETAFDWLEDLLITLPRPFLGYFHLLPPHAKYRTRKEFIDKFFEDGNTQELKPTHLFAHKWANSLERNEKDRRFYDEFLLYVDAEFKRLFDFLEQNGILEDTIVILTSDHGEIFERGYHTHGGISLHEPLVRIPLFIFDPDNSRRVDIYEPTSAVDIVPTLMQLTGKPLPEVVEGGVLPPYANQSGARNVYALQAEGNYPRSVIKYGTAMITRDEYKLTYYFGYPELQGQGPLIELYNLVDDPEELNNLYHPNDQIGKTLLTKLLDTMETAEKPYLKG